MDILQTGITGRQISQKQNRKEIGLYQRSSSMARAREIGMTMVDVSNKPEVFREAIAKGTIKLKNETVRLIEERKISKGDPLYAARIAGIMAAKKTSTLIPLCHPLPLTNVDIEARIVNGTTVQVTSTVKTKAQTGVEMEALTAAAVSLLTIWDMVKQYEKDADGQYHSTVIDSICVTRKLKKEALNEPKRKNPQG
jgi:cyclic pyranopterin phosphate synthase